MKVVNDLRIWVDFCGQVGEGDLCRLTGRGESVFVPQKQKGPSRREGQRWGIGAKPLSEMPPRYNSRGDGGYEIMPDRSV